MAGVSNPASAPLAVQLHPNGEPFHVQDREVDGQAEQAMEPMVQLELPKGDPAMQPFGGESIDPALQDPWNHEEPHQEPESVETRQDQNQAPPAAEKDRA